jgi:hypothetical protein
MNRHALRLSLLIAPVLAAWGGNSVGAATTEPVLPVPSPHANANGSALTFSSSGFIDTNNPFFKAMGNGRACATCHQEGEGWSVSPGGLQARFNNSNGTDPIFRLVDGANSPLAPTATLDQKRIAYSMLLTRGVIRVGLPIPANAEFTLLRATDPYNFASARELSLFRRPLPSANLKFAAAVMWDTRETQADAASKICILNARPARCFAPIDTDLLHQADSAVKGHAEAAAGLTAAEQRAIVDFEKNLFNAQSVSNVAGSLVDGGALGGPARLALQDFYFGINDVQDGDYRTRAPFSRNVSNLFAAWRNLDAPPPPPPAPVRGRPAPPAPAPVSTQNAARAAIARGEQIFNNRPMNIAGVAGFSDDLRPGLQRGSCTSCHNAPNAMSHSVARTFNTGVAAANLRTPDMPLYALRNTATGEVVETSDPGVAMTSGLWRDVGKFKTPNLRGLSARAPYFHDGSSRTLEDVVRFYDRRFRMGLSVQEQADLAAYLKVL